METKEVLDNLGQSEEELLKIEDKLFAHIHNDQHLVGARYLEGMQFHETISRLIAFLQQLGNREIPRLSDLTREFDLLLTITHQILLFQTLISSLDSDNKSDLDFSNSISEQIINTLLEKKISISELSSDFKVKPTSGQKGLLFQNASNAPLPVPHTEETTPPPTNPISQITAKQKKIKEKRQNL